MYCGYNYKCSTDYQGVLIFQIMYSSYAIAPFGTVTKCVDYDAGVIIINFSSILINKFHYIWKHCDITIVTVEF